MKTYKINKFYSDCELVRELERRYYFGYGSFIPPIIKLNPYQKNIINDLEKYMVHDIFPPKRASGTSTIIALYLLHKALFEKPNNIILTSNKLAIAEYNLRIMYEIIKSNLFNIQNLSIRRDKIIINNTKIYAISSNSLMSNIIGIQINYFWADTTPLITAHEHADIYKAKVAICPYVNKIIHSYN